MLLNYFKFQIVFLTCINFNLFSLSIRCFTLCSLSQKSKIEGGRLFLCYATELYTFNMFIYSQHILNIPYIVYCELASEVRCEDNC